HRLGTAITQATTGGCCGHHRPSRSVRRSGHGGRLSHRSEYEWAHPTAYVEGQDDTATRGAVTPSTPRPPAAPAWPTIRCRSSALHRMLLDGHRSAEPRTLSEKRPGDSCTRR